jgi:hypothetical protein
MLPDKRYAFANPSSISSFQRIHDIGALNRHFKPGTRAGDIPEDNLVHILEVVANRI